MTITIMEGTEARPYQCPLCVRFFYFDHDYIKHKCTVLKYRRRK